MPLIDDFLPRYQFSERHAIAIDAPASAIFDIILSRDFLTGDRAVRTMMALRALPIALWETVFPSKRPTMTGFGMHSFTPLGRDGDRELLYGLIGRFWRPDGGLHVFSEDDAFARVEAFRNFRERGVAKLAFNLACEPLEDRTRLATETRVFCPDVRSRLLFAPYWLAIRWGSGFIRKRFLKAVKQAAESRALKHSPHPEKSFATLQIFRPSLKGRVKERNR